ncbi:hypothetical protein ABEB36_009612 [Hypothenemus hampei]|uniref:Peptidase A2 domain-containing protein n=1 Tax=Hypothenemus hampei TaxID=57062 RepID=A0ABD1EGV8_HYPHA
MASANTTVGDALRQVIDPATPKFVQPPIFRPASDSPSSFLLGYERAAIGNGWSDNYKILYLGQFLEGPAHKWYQKYLADDENTGNNWETIKKDLKAEFMEGQQQELTSNNFYHKKQGYAEDIKHYYYELQGLADEVNLDMPFANFLAQFEKGLHPKFRQLYYILKDNDTNHEILKNIVQKLQRSQESLWDNGPTMIPFNNYYPRNNSHYRPNNQYRVNFHTNTRPFYTSINTSSTHYYYYYKYIDIVLDTGAGRSIIRKNIATKIDKIHSNIDIIGAGGIRIPIIGKNIGKIELGNVKIYTPLLIANHLSRPVILGNDFLQRTGAIINYRDNTISLEFGGNRIQLKFTNTSSTSPLGTISPDTTHQPPPHNIALRTGGKRRIQHHELLIQDKSSKPTTNRLGDSSINWDKLPNPRLPSNGSLVQITLNFASNPAREIPGSARINPRTTTNSSSNASRLAQDYSKKKKRKKRKNKTINKKGNQTHHRD